MHTIGFNEKNYMKEPLIYLGRNSCFEKSVLDYFANKKEQLHCEKIAAICHRVSFSLFAQHLVEIFNQCDRFWIEYQNCPEILVSKFKEAVALTCGIISSVEGIWNPDYAKKYLSYKIDDGELNKAYIIFVREEMAKQKNGTFISTFLDNMHLAFYSFFQPECPVSFQVFLSDNPLRKMFYAYLAYQLDLLVDFLNNRMSNLKLGNSTTNRSIGSSFDCDRQYELIFSNEPTPAHCLDGSSIEINPGNGFFLIDNPVDAISIFNLCTVAWQEHFHLTVKLFLFTACTSSGKKIIVSSGEINTPYTDSELRPCAYPILVKTPDMDVPFLISNPEQI